jgi:hypothetical protein
MGLKSDGRILWPAARAMQYHAVDFEKLGKFKIAEIGPT